MKDFSRHDDNRDWFAPCPRPATTPSWKTEVPVEERQGDYVIKKVGERCEKILDLTKKSAKIPQPLHPERDDDKRRRMLEKEKRLLANGNRGGLDKEGGAEVMKVVKRQLKALLKRQNSGTVRTRSPY